jgi:hypothetical protein
MWVGVDSFAVQPKLYIYGIAQEMSTESQLSTYPDRHNSQLPAHELARRTAQSRLRLRQPDLDRQRCAWPGASARHFSTVSWTADQPTQSRLAIRRGAQDPGVLYWIDRVLGQSQSRSCDPAAVNQLQQDIRAAIDSGV